MHFDRLRLGQHPPSGWLPETVQPVPPEANVAMNLDLSDTEALRARIEEAEMLDVRYAHLEDSELRQLAAVLSPSTGNVCHMTTCADQEAKFLPDFETFPA
jgi:hypothetical protein